MKCTTLSGSSHSKLMEGFDLSSLGVGFCLSDPDVVNLGFFLAGSEGMHSTCRLVPGVQSNQLVTLHEHLQVRDVVRRVTQRWAHKPSHMWWNFSERCVEVSQQHHRVSGRDSVEALIRTDAGSSRPAAVVAVQTYHWDHMSSGR